MGAAAASLANMLWKAPALREAFEAVVLSTGAVGAEGVRCA